MSPSRGKVLQGEGFKVEVEVNRHEGYLRAYVFDGTDSRAVSVALWALLGAQCRQYAMQRLLVVEDLEDTISTTDIDVVIDTMVDNGFAGIRTAFVELRDDYPVNEQGGILALEQGIIAQVFSNEIEARRWLLYGGD